MGEGRREVKDKTRGIKSSKKKAKSNQKVRQKIRKSESHTKGLKSENLIFR